MTATVPKHADNRLLGIGAESDTFYRSSQIQLDGDRAPLITQVRLKNLPSGEYAVVAVLRDSRGNETSVTRKAVVLSSAGERQ